MAVNSVDVGRNVVLEFQTGLDGSGNPILRKRSYSNVKSAAVAQDVYDTALAMGNLSAHTVNGVYDYKNLRLEEV